jgi:cyclopropane fatty-acyl-phospholipid synthase-like methyltransferase
MAVKKQAQQNVADYYNNNTENFLKRGKETEHGAIHRKLFPPGVGSSTEASLYVNELILEVIRETGSRRILDLGCGVGGTIRYLEKRYPADYTGITISRVQVEMARPFRTPVELADFQDSTWFRRQAAFDLLYAVESLQHNPDHENLVTNLLSVMEKDAVLVVIDDFLFEKPPNRGRPLRRIRRFIENWHAHGYTWIDDFITLCAQQGLVLRDKTDLTGYMKNTPLRNLLISIPAALFSALPRRPSGLQNLVGGHTLKLLQQRGYSGYYKLVFQRK